MAERREQTEIGRRETAPPADGKGVFRDILAGMTPVRALPDTGFEPHLAALDEGILLHHHRIGALRHRRPGEDANSLAAFNGTLKGMAGGGAAANRQHRLTLGRQISVHDRESVDGAIGVRRQVESGDAIGSEDAASALGDRHRLDLDDGGNALGDQRQRGIDAEELAAEGKAVIAQLCHAPNPRWPAMKRATVGGSPSGNSGNGAASGSSEAIATTCGSSG